MLGHPLGDMDKGGQDFACISDPLVAAGGREHRSQVVVRGPGKGRLGGRGRVPRAQLTMPSSTRLPPTQDAVFWSFLPAAQQRRQVPPRLQPGLQGWRTGLVATEGQGWREGLRGLPGSHIEAPAFISAATALTVPSSSLSGFLRVPSDVLDSILSPLPLVFWNMTHAHR